MAPFPRKLLADHEKIVFDLKPHWVALVVPSLWSAAFIAAWIFLLGFVGDKTDGDATRYLRWAVTIFGLTGIFYYGVFPIARWATTHFVLTTDRLITRHGVIAKHSREIPLERINDVTFNMTVIERMVGAGDLMIESAGERGQSRITHVRKPEEVQLMIYKEVEANNNRMYTGGRTDTATHAAAAPREQTVPEQIEALARLKESGAISELEFENKKQELLKRM